MFPAGTPPVSRDPRPPPPFPPPPPSAARHNLPPATDQFFGRQIIQQQIHNRLDQPFCRLVTITGQGGVGKTRLASTIAHGRTSRFPDGGWRVAVRRG